MADPRGRGAGATDLTRWLEPLFWAEDEHLLGLLAAAEGRGLPAINNGADQGRLLQVLIAAGGARRVLELGTLAGYSATWMARALPADGVVDTVEVDPERCAVAEEWFARAGLAGRVRIHRGRALEVLSGLEPGYDIAFIDAVKTEYTAYLEHLLRLVRPGGLICADNVHWGGRVADPAVSDPDTEGLRAFLRRIASEPRLLSTVVPAGDGLSISVVRSGS